ncbi:MAG: hypothetical protein KAS92_07905, partial [Candidatus Omnitrophica bacterium]|nr:hypothetical protein [Candidatus Omnitrophota bacterium]
MSKELFKAIISHLIIPHFIKPSFLTEQGVVMLNILRKKGFAKKVIWAVAIVIIISFGFGGTFYLLSGN